AVLVAERELLGGDVGDRVLSHRAEHMLHRDERSERVPVGMLMRYEHKAVAKAQRLDRARTRIGDALARDAHEPPSSPSSSSCSTRAARAAVSSSMKLSAGVRLRRSSSAMRR